MYTHVEQKGIEAEYHEQKHCEQVALPLRGRTRFLVLDDLNYKPEENGDNLCQNYILTSRCFNDKPEENIDNLCQNFILTSHSLNDKHAENRDNLCENYILTLQCLNDKPEEN